MSLTNCLIKRTISTTTICCGKKNFRKFPLYNKRGTRIFKQQQMTNPDPDVPVDKRGVRDVGYAVDGKFVLIPEMVPDLVVPNLKDFKLKPYVSYRAPDIIQSELTAENLFNEVYASKIIDDFRKGQLDEDGNPKNPSVEEKLTPEEAKIKARQCGSDIFTQELKEKQEF